MDRQSYVPFNETSDKWTFTTINSIHEDIATRGIIMWCIENMEGKWTLAGQGKFGFEESIDATLFQMHFGFQE